MQNLPKRLAKPSKNLPKRPPEPSTTLILSVTWPSWLLTLPQLHCNVILNRNFCDFPPKLIPKWIEKPSKSHLSRLSSCNFIHTTRNLIFALVSKWNAHFYFLGGNLIKLMWPNQGSQKFQTALIAKLPLAETRVATIPNLRFTVLLAPGADICRRHLD